MTAAPSNLPASIHDRLRNNAKEQGRPFQEVLQYYGIERFLYRLSVSEYANIFVLKGGVLFTAWRLTLRRPTRDIDLHGHTDHTIEDLLKMIQMICVQVVEPDGINFAPKSVRGEQIQAQTEFAGVRIRFIGYLGSIRIPMRVDIAFADAINPPAKQIIYPTILGMQEPRLLAYVYDTVIAEKLQAIVFWGSANTRMKDFYDIRLLSQEVILEGNALTGAIITTFNTRNTPIPDSIPTSLLDGFELQFQQQWSAFLRKFDGETDELADFEKVIEELRKFLDPPLLAAAEGSEFKKAWNPGDGWM